MQSGSKFSAVSARFSSGWRRRKAYVDHALGGVVLLAAYELSTLSGHWADVRERATVARQARSLRQLVDEQIDLLPETRVRLTSDHEERKQIVRGWVDCLKRIEQRVA